MADAAARTRKEQGLLLARCRSGDPAALAEVYDATCDAVYRLCLCILGAPAVAERVTLETYREVWHTAGDFDGHRFSLAAWVLAAAQRRAMTSRGQVQP
jgi:RNA polymerase sigma-70 factor, ECF subfamily